MRWAALAWGAEGERVAIDRYAIHQPPDDAPSAKGDDGKYRIGAHFVNLHDEDREKLATCVERIHNEEHEDADNAQS